MKQYIENYCMTCEQCVAKKLPVHKYRAPLGQYLVREPMERVALDIIGPLTLSKMENRFILEYSFTKWTEAYAIPDQEANTIIRVFVNEFVHYKYTVIVVPTSHFRLSERCVIF